MDAAQRKQQIKDMLNETPDDPELRYMLAMEYVSTGDDETAVSTFREIITRVPDYPPAYHQAGRALQRLNRLNEAREVLKQGIPVALKLGNQHAADEMQELLAMLD